MAYLGQDSEASRIVHLDVEADTISADEATAIAEHINDGDILGG